jgi:hypothetical protein
MRLLEPIKKKVGMALRVIPVLVALWPATLMHASDCASQAPRAVERNTLVSTRDPVARIEVDENLKYVGAFRFDLKHIACVERHIFAAVHNHRITRLFIVQLEGILESSSEIYRWSMRDAIRLGDGEYRHNVWAFDTAASIREEPEAETAKTDAFLKGKALELESELVMSRFARVVGKDRKHELILFYMEPLAGWHQRVVDFPDGEPRTPVQRELARQVSERSLRAFRVVP